jgi:hypothetical protein
MMRIPRNHDSCQTRHAGNLPFPWRSVNENQYRVPGIPCSHHPIGEDIGRVKIPRWITQYVGGKLDVLHVQGHDFPDDVSPYRLVIHCGACMWNRREMLSRILRCRAAGVPITNYGLAIAYSLGIFERSLEPFPAALDIYKRTGGFQRFQRLGRHSPDGDKSLRQT